MNFVFDTNILLYYIKRHEWADRITTHVEPFSRGNFSIISVVTEAEIKSIAGQRQWGENRGRALDALLSQFLKVPVSSYDLLDKYVEIDVYSQGKDGSREYPNNFSARNMGKNDIWIAATAAITESSIITNDGDFDHLHNVFFNVIKPTDFN